MARHVLTAQLVGTFAGTAAHSVLVEAWKQLRRVKGSGSQQESLWAKSFAAPRLLEL